MITKRGVVPTSTVNMPIELPPLTLENMWQESEFFLRDGEVYLVWKNSNNSFSTFHSLSEFLSDKQLIMGVWFTSENLQTLQLPNRPDLVMSYHMERNQ